jgi:hypothetical protein
MKNLFALSVLLGCLLLPSKSGAQFITHYNVYTSDSLQSDGQTVVHSATLEGYTQVPNGMPNNIVHTPYIYNTLGSAKNGGPGQGACPTCYLNYTLSLGDVPGVGNLIDDDDVFQIVCTLAGAFWRYVITSQGEIAVTTSIQAGPVKIPVPGEYYRPLSAWCDIAHTPPDFNPGFYFGGDPRASTATYFLGSAFCLRSGSGGAWVCSPGAGGPLSFVAGSLPPQACTKTP